MASLHIEHPITDLNAWIAAFDRFAEIRHLAGVTAESVRHVHGDDRYVVVDLEFDTCAEANDFLQFLRAEVWGVPANSPALDGPPDAKVLEPVRRA